jgi:hypothetical protein
MIRTELKRLKLGPKDLRKFGLLVGGAFLLLGGWFLFRHKSWYPWFLAPGVLLVGLGLVAPRALKQAYLGWMAMAFALGLVVSTVLLTLFYYLVVTPVGLLAKLVGKDFLGLRRSASARSYWLPRQGGPRPPADYEQQF